MFNSNSCRACHPLHYGIGERLVSDPPPRGSKDKGGALYTGPWRLSFRRTFGSCSR
jgi:hypothetical protein